MKCSACQIELVESPREHYKTELHRINVHRQIYNAPPISIEEFTSKGHSSEMSLEIFREEQLQDVSEEENMKKSTKQNIKVTKPEVCLLCLQNESLDHYLGHGLDERQATYLMEMTCYVCNEGFTTKKGLKEHLLNENHRKAFLKDDNLVLENGKVLCWKSKGSTSELPIIKNNRRGGEQIVRIDNTAQHEVEKRESERNKLKTSLRMNIQKHFRPDWMQ